MIKKADIILFVVLLILGAFITIFSLQNNNSGDTVKVSVDGKLYGEYSLSEDQEIEIENNGHLNHITIKDGFVQMSSSSCHNQVCVDTGKINETKDRIVCLPNKVVIEIESKTGGGMDVISG